MVHQVVPRTHTVMSAMACSTTSFMLSRTVVSARQQNRIKAAKVVCQSSDGASAPTKSRKPSPLETGGTLQGSKAAGKDAGAAALSQLKGKPYVHFLDFHDGWRNAFTWQKFARFVADLHCTNEVNILESLIPFHLRFLCPASSNRLMVC